MDNKITIYLRHAMLKVGFTAAAKSIDPGQPVQSAQVDLG